ncbi:Gpi1-domain-containing protein [Leucogyrophana mollusca]|uniref:Gpi1-domain-containing protein n=1 Tax=Leucogyrophana mollusca TaxID=85980 RepID=A0ACB8AZE2_9AGAM|nr:Gpi1-domain-containing protein [Leucogyrophana mollusca]
MDTTIFWPSDVSYDGFCYGWILPAVCVAGVLVADSIAQANSVLDHVYLSKHYLSLENLCGRPAILGRCTFRQSMDVRDRDCFPPDIEDCGGSLGRLPNFNSRPYHVIYYRRHEATSMRFYSMDDPWLTTIGRRTLARPPFHESFMEHDFTGTRNVPLTPGKSITLINQWNSAKQLHHLVETSGMKFHLNSTSQSSRISSIGSLLLTFMQSSQCLQRISGVLHSIAVLSMRLGFVSTAVQQLDVRTRNFIRILAASHNIRSQRVSPSQYIEFYNGVWIILNDIIIGVAFRRFLRDNRVLLAEMIVRGLEVVTVGWIQNTLVWLDSWPAGLKLNTELSRFYAYSFIGMMGLWKRLFGLWLPMIPVTIGVVEIASCFGVTMVLSLLSDFLCLLTVHIHLCYVVSSTIYHHVLRLVGSLWNLFRAGKRYNVLRNRTDSWDYDVDQLLLGTILFTLVAHLFPTIMVYYALFALLRLSIIILHASLETILAFMNHFPLFALMLRAKDSQRSPGRISMLNMLGENTDGRVVMVESHPLPFSVIFVQYVELWYRLAEHYHPSRLARYIFIGQLITVIPRDSIHYLSNKSLDNA